jgi:AhpC/TSA family protein
VAAISYDSPEIMAAFSKQRGISFPLLGDKGSAVIRRYGLLNPLPELAFGPTKDDPDVKAEIQKYVSAVGARADMAGMAFPGTIVLDRGGRVTSRFFEDFYVERNTVSSLLLKLGGAAGSPVEGKKFSTSHLDVTAYPSDASVAVGNRFSVILDVEPHAHLHVYAPGAEGKGYRVISLALDPHPQIRALPLRYPASEIYYFKPLKERVPVFEKPFRLAQELVVDGSLAGQEALRGKDSLTVTGALQYQACDDKICYNPVSLPVSWQVSLHAIIRERPTVTR